MARKVFFGSVLLICVGLLWSRFRPVPPKPIHIQQALLVEDLDRTVLDLDTMVLDDLDQKHDGEEVTVQCTVINIHGVSQLNKKGQASTFVIEVECGMQRRKLDLWVEGELANMLDRFQMNFWQENGFKMGNKLIVKGTLHVNPTFLNVGHPSPEIPYYRIFVNQWQNFRVLPTNGTK